MGGTQVVVAYTDYKSPYAFLAKDLTYELRAVQRSIPLTE